MTDTVKRIEEIRKEQGMSRAKMCRLAGNLAPTSYNNYLVRGNEPPIGVTEAIARALGVTVGQLRIGASVSQSLDREMTVLTEKISTLPAISQERIINTMNSLVDAYMEAHHDK